jgi:hypothetical protein
MKLAVDFDTDDIWVDADTTLKNILKEVLEEEVRRTIRREAKVLLQEQQAEIRKRARDVLERSLKETP